MNHHKIKRIRKNEELLKKIQCGQSYLCSNFKCKNTVILNEEEAKRRISCGKCGRGYFVTIKEKNKIVQKIKADSK